MPLVTIEALEGTFTPDEKRRLIERVTDAIVEIEGEFARPVTWVRIKEFEDGCWGIGGEPMHSADVREKRAEEWAGQRET